MNLKFDKMQSSDDKKMKDELQEAWNKIIEEVIKWYILRVFFMNYQHKKRIKRIRKKMAKN